MPVTKMNCVFMYIIHVHSSTTFSQNYLIINTILRSQKSVLTINEKSVLKAIICFVKVERLKCSMKLSDKMFVT